MKIHSNIKPIVITLIAIGFFVGVKWQFPIYSINSTNMFDDYGRGSYVLVSKLHPIEAGDVVVFENNSKLLISRVVGASGDKIECVDAELLRNQEAIHRQAVRFMYNIICDSTTQLNGLTQVKEVYPKRNYRGLMKPNEAEKLKTKPGVISVERIIHPSNGVSMVTKEYTRAYWSRDNFGPLEVPEDCFFLVNDNRANSNDSRELGSIDKKDIIGKVITRL